MKTLAIETSCDDTSIGIINFDGKAFSVDEILAYSQVKEHNEFGGVVPEIASRLHSEKIIAVLNQIGRDKIRQVDNITVTAYPGLPGSLVVGKTVAAQLGEYFDKPVIPVDHIIGHIFALFLDRDMTKIQFPMIILTASGGHNNIYHVDTLSNSVSPHSDPLLEGGEEDHEKTNHPASLSSKEREVKSEVSERNKEGNVRKVKSEVRGKYEITKIGQTLDDAAGECFDKVSRMLGGPYPGGVRISKQAARGRPNERFKLNRIRLSSDKFEFSFSGIKSQINHLINKQKATVTIPLNSCPRFDCDPMDNLFTPQEIADIAYEFQESIVEVLGKKLARAALKYNAKTIGLSGGVSANDRLREYIAELLENKQRLKNQISHDDNISTSPNLSTPHLSSPGRRGKYDAKAPLLEGEGLEGGVKLLVPAKKLYCTDNAAMIGVAGLLK